MFTKSAKPAFVPEGFRIYAVGDIHGRLDLLDQLLRMIVLDSSVKSPAQTQLIFLGDYIDRGPDSAQVIDRLIRGLPVQFQHVCLRGNHEDMMLRSVANGAELPLWLRNGGMETLESYGIDISRSEVGANNAKLLTDHLAQAVPEAHWRFLRELRNNISIGDYFFVHAGVRPEIALDHQNPQDCFWIREEFLKYSKSFGKIIVHGHTPVPEPEMLHNRIGIDTGAFITGRLTALCLERDQRQLLST